MGNTSRKTRPLVSVLMPVYNGERYLELSLRSARTQTYRELEIIIRDDGSSDGSLELAKQAAERDPRIRVIAAGTDRRGGTGNMIELLRHASGEFVKYLHQDDLLEPACVEQLVRPMRFDSALVLASSSRYRIDSDGVPTEKTLPAYRPLRPRDMKLPGSVVLSEMLNTMFNQVGEPSVPLFRNGIVAPEGAFVVDGRTYSYINDMALWVNLLRQGDLFWHAAPLSSFRVHDGQRSAKLHESITAGGELADLAAFAVSNGLISPADAHRHARHLSGYVNELYGAVQMLPSDDRIDHLELMAAAVASVRALAATRQSSVAETVR